MSGAVTLPSAYRLEKEEARVLARTEAQRSPALLADVEAFARRVVQEWRAQIGTPDPDQIAMIAGVCRTMAHAHQKRGVRVLQGER